MAETQKAEGIRQKAEKIKLNLGFGAHMLPGYRNLDIQNAFEPFPAYPLDVVDGTCDEIRASHLLEHFGYHQTADVLADWVSKLKPGGILKIAVPGFNKIVSGFECGPIEPYIMGGQVDEYDFHKAIFTHDKLMQQMQNAGLIHVGGWSDDFRDSASLHVSLNLKGTKPINGIDVTTMDDVDRKIIPNPLDEKQTPEFVSDVGDSGKVADMGKVNYGDWDKTGKAEHPAGHIPAMPEGRGYMVDARPPEQIAADQLVAEKVRLDELAANDKPIRIQAVMSMPRLAFTENSFSAMNAFRSTGINVDRATGAFWEQGLTRLMERFTNEGFDYLIAVDYDTYFTREQVVRLCQLMVENPDVDCIVSMQAKREEDVMLMGWDVPEGEDKAAWMKKQIIENELIPIVTGHFGLTIIKCDALKTIGKPWFNSIPGPDGSWNEGRVDADIYFWHNMKKCGKKVMLAPRIQIGHLQQMVTYPGPIENGLHPEHHYMNDIRANGLPEHCRL
jgi:predicted SAM-dependent methyltransferase